MRTIYRFLNFILLLPVLFLVASCDPAEEFEFESFRKARKAEAEKRALEEQAKEQAIREKLEKEKNVPVCTETQARNALLDNILSPKDITELILVAVRGKIYDYGDYGYNQEYYFLAHKSYQRIFLRKFIPARAVVAYSIDLDTDCRVANPSRNAKEYYFSKTRLDYYARTYYYGESRGRLDSLKLLDVMIAQHLYNPNREEVEKFLGDHGLKSSLESLEELIELRVKRENSMKAQKCPESYANAAARSARQETMKELLLAARDGHTQYFLALGAQSGFQVFSIDIDSSCQFIPGSVWLFDLRKDQVMEAWNAVIRKHAYKPNLVKSRWFVEKHCCNR